MLSFFGTYLLLLPLLSTVVLGATEDSHDYSPWHPPKDNTVEAALDKLRQLTDATLNDFCSLCLKSALTITETLSDEELMQIEDREEMRKELWMRKLRPQLVGLTVLPCLISPFQTSDIDHYNI